jgi:uncharacterized Zn finger protein (UPF0148 family)
VSDCPNCGKPVEEGAALCPHCGFDVNSRQADEVRRLREEGRIHPGRLSEQARGQYDDVGPPTRGGQIEELPAEDLSRDGPEEFDAGL